MDNMTPEALKNRAELADIRYNLLKQVITYDEARARAQPILDRMNARGAEIARESGMRFKPITFAAVMR